MSVTQNHSKPVWYVVQRLVPNVSPGWGPTMYTNNQASNGHPITINGTTYPVIASQLQSFTILGLWNGSDGVDSKGTIVRAEIGVVTWAPEAQQNLRGKLMVRYRHGNYNSGSDGENWVVIG